MNYHSDKWIMERLQEHYDEALQYFQEDQIVGIFLQGSQNYGLDYEGSDIDTKLIVVPTFENIAMNKKPVSTTHVRANDEHIDFKDVRLYMQTFRKQNLNFLEILFTPYKIVNPLYAEDWDKLIVYREEIARYNLPAAIKAMKGVALEKYFAMTHEYPSRMEWINKFGYDPKQLHHLLRVEEYLSRYIAGESYESCLKPHNPEYLVKVKKGCYGLAMAQAVADTAKENIEKMCTEFLEHCPQNSNARVDVLLDTVQLDVMRKAITLELE